MVVRFLAAGRVWTLRHGRSGQPVVGRLCIV